MKPKIYLLCLFLMISISSFSQADTWSVKFCDAIISRYQPTINTMTNKGWEYSNGIILHGMEKVYLQTNTAAYLNYIKAYVDAYVDANGNVTGLGTTVDKIQPGVLCLFLYEQTGQLKYKTAAINIKNYLLSTNPVNFNKTPDGGYWHKNDGNYNNVMMVDGMYMLHPFLAKCAYVLNDPTLYDVATFQMLLLASHVMPSPKTLPKHAWDYSKTKVWADPTTGESTDVWSRGTGWYMMALADVLSYLPTTHANYAAILELFQRMASGVAAKQNAATGLWYQVVDKGTTSGNWIESSGSGMFIYALKKGIDNGWLNSTVYLPVCQAAWTGMQTKIATYTDGKPQIKGFCPATGVLNNTAAYLALSAVNCPATSGTQHPHGYCAILMAASEMEFPIVQIPVTGVTVSPTSAALNVGNTQQLTATVAPANATNKTVTWTTSNSAVATVSTTGLVTATGAGTATITVTTQDGGFTATSVITSTSVAVTGVTVSPTTASISVAGTTTLTATVLPSNATNKSVTWSSGNTGVATVSTSGMVTGVAAGSATITATTQDGGFTASCAVTVTQGCTATGYITFQRWDNITGTAVSNLTSNVNYPNSPTSTTTRTLFEIPSNAANNYGCRVSGYICAPLTGGYTFWIAGDDNVELWLSTNSTEASKVKIAYHTGYTNSRQWTKFTTQKSAVINLVQGVTYYVEALMKEGTGSDNLAVGWLKPGQTGTSPSEVIPGSVLSPRGSAPSMPLSDEGFVNPNMEKTMIIYPNPARDYINMLIPANMLNKDAVISIISFNGRMILQEKRTLNSTENINLNNVANGLYILRIDTKDESVNKKISVIK
jgi:unsaturated rhamnogalacturonyl hydrolase